MNRPRHFIVGLTMIGLPLPVACTAREHAADSDGSTGAPADTGPGPGDAPACGPDAPTGLDVGDCAPDFTLLDSTGQPFTLSDQRGKVALVDISAVW